MNLLPFGQSLKIFRRRLQEIQPVPETIPTGQALGRVLAQEVYASRSNPEFASAAMDGIAINVFDVPHYPAKLNPGMWIRINTGEKVPGGFNAVVRIEDVEWEGDHAIVSKPVEFMQNVRSVGEDFEKGKLLFPASYQLQPQDISLLLSAGHEKIQVYKRPLICFIPTGNELIQSPWLETNSAMVSGLVEKAGGNFCVFPPVADEEESIKKALREAVGKSEIVILSAGTSKGTRDISAKVMEELGKLYFHGVGVNPGRPVFFGDIGDVPVLGLPGYPAAAYVASFVYLQPLVCAFSGVKIPPRREILICAEDIPEQQTDHFYRVNCFDVDGRVYVRKIPRGAGSVFSLGQMDGLMHVPAATPIKKRDAVRVDIIQDRSQNTWAIRGIGDPILLYLFDLFRAQNPDFRILFWETTPEEALENIVERNAHGAVIATVPEHDLFPPFANQLQDYMTRIRIFTRTVGLFPLRDSLSTPYRVAIPVRNRFLWEYWLKSTHQEANQYTPIFLSSPDPVLLQHSGSRGWDALFVDIRFLKAGTLAYFLQEHLDLVISESYLSHPAIKNLIALLLSDEFGAWVAAHRGCDVQSRGLVEEAHETIF